MRRRHFLGLALAFLPGTVASATASRSASAAIRSIESKTGGRLGVHAIDMTSGATVSYRSGERFAMCSTFKMLAVAAVLARVDRGETSLAMEVHFGKSDLLAYAPVAREHVAAGVMTVETLCAAAIVYSDNTAANLLLRILGGPAAVTAYARSIGDRVTRLDRIEPELNTALPGDPRDTTTPEAMADDLSRVVLGDHLSAASRAKLQSWMVKCTTGTGLLRAGVPASWRAGDKTGLGGRNNVHGDSDTRNDIAVVWPPGRAPIVIAAYLTGAQVAAKDRDDALADVGRTVIRAFG